MLCLKHSTELRIEFFVNVKDFLNNKQTNTPEMNTAIVIMMCLDSNPAIGSDPIPL